METIGELFFFDSVIYSELPNSPEVLSIDSVFKYFLAPFREPVTDLGDFGNDLAFWTASSLSWRALS